MKTKVTYIISAINKAVSFEWIALNLDKNRFELSFILLNKGDSDLHNFLVKHSFKCISVKYSGKKDILPALFKVIRLLRQLKPSIVHTHLFDANIVGLTAAKICGIKTRIYTRHHSTYHHEYFPPAVKYDRYCNKLATDIIAISELVKQVLIKKEGADPKKISLIYHGFNLELFRNVPAGEVQKLREKYNLDNHYPIVGVISRYTEWKGIQYIIPAFRNILQSHPRAKLLLANATGDYGTTIQGLLSDLPADSYVETAFESNLFALYKTFDVFVHVPIDQHCEAFGQTYVEALASGVPSVFTLSGIAREFARDKENSLVVDYKSSGQIASAIKTIIDDPRLRERIITRGNADVQQFNLQAMIGSLESLYSKAENGK